ncbi:MAG: hypothetical protein RL710_3429 [Pseudomonadota bacterium]|jgi:hypothetical protein|nr:phospholipase [Rhodoferax sp.]
MQALCLYAGPTARKHIEKNGLQPGDIGTVPGAAGGPKGLILGPLDRFIFGQWLPQSSQPVHLVGASIGAWRMATACLNHPVAAFERLEHDYIHQHYHLEPGEKRPTAALVSELFGRNLQAFYKGHVAQVLHHPRYKLHIVTSRGRHILGREQRWRTPLGYLGAFMTNTVHRKAMGAWLERVVFSSPLAPLPFATSDYRTRQVALTDANFELALQASCSIPFVLQAIHNIPGAPPGAFWDGGITDYHLHLNYAGAPDATKIVAGCADSEGAAGQKGLVLYPHFQKSVVPGWLDKHLKWRYKPTHFLDTVVLLAPNPQWVKTLPNGKLPDRNDFTHYGQDLAGRVKAWSAATAASAQLADEFEAWLRRPDSAKVQAL